MRKMYYLMLMLLISTVSMNAQVKIGSSTADPHTGAVLDLKNTGVKKGLLLPNVALNPNLTDFVLDTGGTYTKENATGMLVYNTTDSKVYFWNGTKWELISSLVPPVTLSSIAVTGTPTKTGYAIDESFDPTGLTVTGTNSDGSEVDIPVGECTFTPNPLTRGTTQVTANYGGKTAVVPVAIYVAAASGSPVKIGENSWITLRNHNLGANESADWKTPSKDLNGNYYQWGRTAAVATVDTPVTYPDTWVASPSYNFNHSVWTSGADDPCTTAFGSGWRLPTNQEWKNIYDNNTFTKVGDNWTSSETNFSTGYTITPNGSSTVSAFLPAAGYRINSGGALTYRGSFGDYSSSTQDSVTSAYDLRFDSGSVTPQRRNGKSFGLSVRCVSE